MQAVKKYFIAIVVPEPLSSTIDTIKHQLHKRYGLKGALRSPSHITLHRPFEWKEKYELKLIETLEKFNFETDFELVLHNFQFFEPRVVYIQVQQNIVLFDLYNSLKNYSARQLKLLNEVNDKRGFHPHITVAFRDLKKTLFYELQSEFKEMPFAAHFTYQGFSLLKLETKWEEIKFFPKSEFSQK
jgi:2'-5' RNA ligase